MFAWIKISTGILRGTATNYGHRTFWDALQSLRTETFIIFWNVFFLFWTNGNGGRPGLFCLKFSIGPSQQFQFWGVPEQRYIFSRWQGLNVTMPGPCNDVRGFWRNMSSGKSPTAGSIHTKITGTLSNSQLVLCCYCLGSNITRSREVQILVSCSKDAFVLASYQKRARLMQCFKRIMKASCCEDLSSLIFRRFIQHFKSCSSLQIVI